MQKNLLRIFIISVVVIGATLTLAVTLDSRAQKAATAPTKAEEIETQPALSLKNMKGEDVDLLKAYPGKTLLVNYWATWCPPCIYEIPSLIEIKVNRQSDKFAVVLVSLDFPKDPESLKALMVRMGLEDIDTLYMTDARQWSSLKGRGLPITVLVSPEGRIMSRFVGGMDWTGPAGTDFLKKVPE